MEERIEKYLIDEKKVGSEVVRRKLIDKVMKYDDVAREFVEWLEKRQYSDDGVKIDGWTAKKIYDIAPMLNGIGVFNFLVTLRDDPEEAEEIIREGFVVK